MLDKAGFATFITIKDMERAIKFYKKLGGKVQSRASGDMKDSWASLKIGREEFWLVKPPGRQPKKPDLAFNAFIVKDLRKEVQDLRKKGVRFQKAEKMDESSTIIDGVISAGAFGSTSFFNDSEGNLMMLWQNS